MTSMIPTKNQNSILMGVEGLTKRGGTAAHSRTTSADLSASLSTTATTSSSNYHENNNGNSSSYIINMNSNSNTANSNNNNNSNSSGNSSSSSPSSTSSSSSSIFSSTTMNLPISPAVRLLLRIAEIGSLFFAVYALSYAAVLSTPLNHLSDGHAFKEHIKNEQIGMKHVNVSMVLFWMCTNVLCALVAARILI